MQVRKSCSRFEAFGTWASAFGFRVSGLGLLILYTSASLGFSRVTECLGEREREGFSKVGFGFSSAMRSQALEFTCRGTKYIKHVH